MNTIFSLTQYAGTQLKDTYEPEEIRSICRLIFTDVLHYTNIDIHLKKHESLNESFVNKFYEIISLLKQEIPIQYIIGETGFSGLTFGLNPSTLIPRPETEELVRWITEESHRHSRILDIGTGSGCIAISLAHHLPDSQISAVDIAREAIEQATANAVRNKTKVQFLIRDILLFHNYNWDKYDIIVSNPPYIRNCEKKTMANNVLNFEPHRALFVPDEDPLVFYRKIAAFGQQQLTPGGMLFFEINEAFGSEMTDLLSQTGYSDITLRKDIYGKDRFIKCQLNTTSDH